MADYSIDGKPTHDEIKQSATACYDNLRNMARENNIYLEPIMSFQQDINDEIIHSYTIAQNLVGICELGKAKNLQEILFQLATNKDKIALHSPELRTVASKLFVLLDSVQDGYNYNYTLNVFKSIEDSFSAESITASIFYIVEFERKASRDMAPLLEVVDPDIKRVCEQAAQAGYSIQPFQKERIIFNKKIGEPPGLSEGQLYPEDPVIILSTIYPTRDGIQPRDRISLLIHLLHESIHRANLAGENFINSMDEVVYLEMITEYSTASLIREFHPDFKDKNIEFRVLTATQGFGYITLARVADAISTAAKECGEEIDITSFGVTQDVNGFKERANQLLSNPTFTDILLTKLVKEILLPAKEDLSEADKINPMNIDQLVQEIVNFTSSLGGLYAVYTRAIFKGDILQAYNEEHGTSWKMVDLLEDFNLLALYEEWFVQRSILR